MKIIVLHVPEEADEARVLAALRALQATTPFYLESDFERLPGPARSADEWEERIRAAEASADVSYEAACARFGL